MTQDMHKDQRDGGLESALEDAPPTPLRPVVLFDSNCRLCLACTTRLRALDGDKQLEWLDVNSHAVPDRFPHIDLTAIHQELHVVSPDGTPRRGVDAVIEIARALGGSQRLSVDIALALPGAHTAGQLLYAMLSQTRKTVKTHPKDM